MSEQNLKDKAAKGFMWGALNNGAMQVLNAVFGIVLASRLSQDDYGLIGMLTIFTLIANSLQDSGFVTALTNRRNATHADFNSVFWFNIGMSATLYVLFFFCAPLISEFYDEPLLTPLSRYYFLGFFIASFSIVPRAILFRQLKQRELAVMALISLIISGSVGITMAYCGMAYWGLATQTLMFNLCVSVTSWWLSGWRPTFTVTFQPVREMFAFSSKMLITNIFVQLNNNLFSLILGKYYTKSEVGIYNQANKWSTMGASTITGMVQGVAQPTFVQVGNDNERLCRAFSKMLRFTCFVSFPAMFGLALIAPEFITILLPERWLPSANLMRILCISGAFLPVATLYYNMIISRGRSSIYMWNVIVQGITILTAALTIQYLTDDTHSGSKFFTFHFSLLTLQFTTIQLMVISYAAIVILWVAVWHWFVRRLIGYSYISALRDILPFLAISAVAMCIAYISTTSLTAPILILASRILIAAAVYLGLMWLLGANILRECLGFILKKGK